jgi:glycosyltransferase involved in cell wall biosynthesis
VDRVTTAPERPDVSIPAVCTLLESYVPVVGGMETQALNMVSSLRDLGVKQLVVTRRSDPGLSREEMIDGVPVYRVGPTGKSSRYRWLFMLTCIPKMIRLRREYDVIFVPGYRVLGIAAVLLARWLNKKCVFKAECIGEMSGEFFTGGLASVKLKRSQGVVQWGIRQRNKLLVKADAFVSMYSDMTTELQDHGVAPHKMEVIPQSVHVERYTPADRTEKAAWREKLGLPATHRIAVYTGRIVSYKGVPVLLRVWNELRRTHPDILLVICGSGGVDIYACEEEMHQYVTDQSMEDGVRFTGAVGNVDAYMKASDLFVLPTENDAFPLCLLEAMACALPLVTTPVGGLKDVIQHERNGLVMTPGSEAELRACLVRLLDDEALCARLGAAAHADVLAHYTRQIVAKRYVDLFTRVVTGTPR